MQGPGADHSGRKALQRILESNTSSSTLAARKEGPSFTFKAFVFSFCSILARIDVSGRLGQQCYESSTINNHEVVAMSHTTRCFGERGGVEMSHTHVYEQLGVTGSCVSRVRTMSYLAARGHFLEGLVDPSATKVSSSGSSRPPAYGIPLGKVAAFYSTKKSRQARFRHRTYLRHNLTQLSPIPL